MENLEREERRQKKQEETGPQRNRSTTGFRLSAKGFFVTFPTCTVPKEDVKQRLSEKWNDELNWAIIAQEHHQDGTLHLHLAFSFHEKKNFKDPKCFDFLTGQHGNYQTMKSPLKAITYCKKEDKEPTIIGNLPENNKKAVSNEVATLLQHGASLRDVSDVAPGFLLLNFKKIEVFQQWVRRENEKRKKLTFVPFVLPADSTQPEIMIVNWLNKNIKQPRQFKQKQLVIQGDHDMRKSSLVRELDKYLTIMYMPNLEDFFDQWEENFYDLIVFDEWEYQQHNPQNMNSILDGSVMNLRIKGGQKMKIQNLPVLILTNQCQMEAFGKGVSLVMRDTFLTRVNWVHLSRPLPIETMLSGLTTGTTILNGNSTTTTLISPTFIPTNPLMMSQSSMSQSDDSFNYGDLSDEIFQ